MNSLTPADLKEMEKLYKAGAHLGHKKNRLHPKARKYVYKMEQGVSIIDLTVTMKQLEGAKNYLSQAAHDEKVILVVATKKIVSQFTATLCEKYEIPYISAKWLSGLLTNFQTIIKNVNNLKKLREDRENGVWDSYVKHERVQLDKKVIRLEKFYKGLVPLLKKPDILVIIDSKKEKNALTEAIQCNIRTVAISDTNSNPDLVTYPVVANDDSPTSAQYLVEELVEAYAQSKIKTQNAKVKEKKAE